MTPEIGPRQVVYANLYQQIYRVKVQFDGFAKDYYVVDCGPRVGVVISRGSDVLLVRQYRLLVNGMTWEVPGGKVDPDETPEAAACREALEETCLHTCDNPTFMFLAEEFEEACEGNLDSREVSERVWLPLEVCVRLIFTGKIVDSLTVAALLALYARKRHPEIVGP